MPTLRTGWRDYNMPVMTTIHLLDDLIAHARRRIIETNHATLTSYIEDLIRADAGLPVGNPPGEDSKVESPPRRRRLLRPVRLRHSSNLRRPAPPHGIGPQSRPQSRQPSAAPSPRLGRAERARRASQEIT